MKRRTAPLCLAALFFITGFFFVDEIAEAGYFDRRPDSAERRRTHKGSSAVNAEKAFLKEDYESVIRYDAQSRFSGRLRQLVGRAFLKLGRYDEARNRFTALINHSDDEEFLDDAYLGLADSYFLEADYNKAADHYGKILRYFPDSDYLPIAYYRLGECYSRLGNDSEARKTYDKLVRLYPYSLEARLAGDAHDSYVSYSVQAGSFNKWKNAKDLCEELKGKGYEAKIHTAVIGKSRFYRVRVGSYNRIGEAEDAARKLKNAGYEVKICP